MLAAQGIKIVMCSSDRISNFSSSGWRLFGSEQSSNNSYGDDIDIAVPPGTTKEPSVAKSSWTEAEEPEPKPERASRRTARTTRHKHPSGSEEEGEDQAQGRHHRHPQQARRHSAYSEDTLSSPHRSGGLGNWKETDEGVSTPIDEDEERALRRAKRMERRKQRLAERAKHEGHSSEEDSDPSWDKQRHDRRHTASSQPHHRRGQHSYEREEWGTANERPRRPRKSRHDNVDTEEQSF